LIQLEHLIQEACSIATSSIQSFGENVVLRSEPYIEKNPHPEGQLAFVIQARLPWHREFYAKVYAEFSFQEIILMDSEERKIIHGYEDSLEGSIYVYPLEEIVAEKIRALLQFAKKLHERGWGRSRVRDYYDLWKIMHSYSNELKLDILPTLVQKNAPTKGSILVELTISFRKNFY
jgi:predicted nucleotidyltransferase component of viral defense system